MHSEGTLIWCYMQQRVNDILCDHANIFVHVKKMSPEHFVHALPSFSIRQEFGADNIHENGKLHGILSKVFARTMPLTHFHTLT